ncbi:type II toxin-antitoxin system RelE/ParE family toxin [Candidatus Bathyarchaeota archaeon]|nr:type II toxin-antitoxin system RelE/ParE family toxin [Candidatus Bathyarchaeota archaeon]
MFTLRVKRKQLRKIEGLPETIRAQIREALRVMKSDPVPVKGFDVRKLAGYGSVYRIRVGDIRLVYSVEWSEKTISIQYIGSRKKAYR